MPRRATESLERCRAKRERLGDVLYRKGYGSSVGVRVFRFRLRKRANLIQEALACLQLPARHERERVLLDGTREIGTWNPERERRTDCVSRLERRPNAFHARLPQLRIPDRLDSPTGTACERGYLPLTHTLPVGPLESRAPIGREGNIAQCIPGQGCNLSDVAVTVGDGHLAPASARVDVGLER